ncbi:MAG: flagellar hook-basal body complex protein FliE, partial [Alphaproteobacteria bacterium]
AAPAGGFASFLNDGIGYVENKVDHANAMVRAFAVDDSVPVHQVTMALADARLAVELAMQVRSRLVEAYRDLMTMQL